MNKHTTETQELSPATTPNSIGDETRFLVPQFTQSEPIKSPWYCKYPPPYAVLIISLAEVIVYLSTDEELLKLLRFDPTRQSQLWRFLTYMFIHDSTFHISLNVVIQCLFAVALEKYQGSIRITLLYFSAGILGALGAACKSPDLVVGASAGAYALLISHISHLLVNFKTIKYRICRCLCVAVIVGADVIYNLYHVKKESEPVIAWGAHVVGAIAGFLLGLVLYKNNESGKSKVWFCFGLIMLLILISFLLILNYQIKKCASKYVIKYKYVYWC